MEPSRAGGCVIAAAPEVGAEAGVGLTFSLALLSAFMFVLCTGLKRAWHDTIGSIFYALAGVGFGGIRGIGSVHPLAFLKDFADGVENKLGDLAAGYEHAMGFWYHQTARLQGWIADETWKLARDTYHFGGWLVHTYVPTYVHGVTDLLHTGGRVVVQRITKVERTTVTVYRVAKANAQTVAKVAVPGVAIPYLWQWHWIHKHWKALTAAVAAAGGLALPRGVAWPEFRRAWKEIEAWRHTTGRRLARLEALLAASGLALAVANMTGTRLACWRGRGNIGRFLRGVCGSPAWLLDVLFLEAFTAFTIFDLCDFIKAEVKLAEWLQPLLMEFVDVDEWLIQHCKYDKAPDLTLPPLTLPSGSYGVALNGPRDVALGLAG